LLQFLFSPMLSFGSSSSFLLFSIRIGSNCTSQRHCHTIAHFAAVFPSCSSRPIHLPRYPSPLGLLERQGVSKRRASSRLVGAMTPIHKSACSLFGAALAAAFLFAGCGTPGAPLPPSLKLPDPITDLGATRAGNQVSLTFTMPRKNTDKLLIKGNLPVRICRKQETESCVEVPNSLLLPPGAKAAFTETLPPALAAGLPRSLTYFVELKNPRGRSAGLSNPAIVLAGQAPVPVAGFSASVRKQGVVLHWTADSESTAVRLQRKLLTPQAESKPQAQSGLMAPAPEPLEQNLLVEQGEQTGAGLDRALDKDVRFGQVYEYRAQRVTRVIAGGKPLELVSELSAPVRVEVLDIFPPAVPTGLAAVATAAQAGAQASIDLSWQPVTDADLAGYIVYRREAGAPNQAWQRISPAEPLVGPAFHDTAIQPGHTYQYAVASISQSGHQSERSAETEETVPNP